MIAQRINNKMYLKLSLTCLFISVANIYADAVENINSADGLTKKLKNGNPSVVVFHSPSCPHCIKFLPKFTKVALKYKGVNCCAVDVSTNLELARSNGVTGVPKTIFYDKTGKKVDEIGGDIGQGILEKTIQLKTGVAPQ